MIFKQSSMKKLTEKEIIRIMKEEWNRKVLSILREEKEEDKKKKDERSVPGTGLSVEVPVAGKRQIVIDRGLKVQSKDEKKLGSRVLYTVEDVDSENKEITLRRDAPSGEKTQKMSWAEFERDYERQ
jgi:hypothetical protein